MKLSAQFDYQQVDHEKDNTVHLLVTVEAPAIDWVAQRPRIFVLPIIDRSASMYGDKFTYAQQACRKLIEQFKPGDYAGLVSFGHEARIEVAPAAVTPEFKALLLRKLDELRPGGGTNFADAITKSLGAMGNMDLPPNILHRVIFFTDGQPTSGVVDRGALKGLVTGNLRSYSMSFFGYGVGTDQCDQAFLTELSQLGKGNYAYVQNADDALAAFGRELGGLLSTYASDLRVVLEPRNGHTIEKVVTVLGPERQLAPASDLTEVSLELGDILAEEVRHIVLECSLKKQDKALPRDFTVINVKATCLRTTSGGERVAEESKAVARVRFVRSSDAQEKPTLEVDQIVVLHQLAVAQREAEAQAAQGNYRAAQAHLGAFSAGVGKRGHVQVASVSASLGAKMEGAAVFNASQGYRTSLLRGNIRPAAVSSYEQAASVDLDQMRCVEQSVGNSAQAAYTSLFTGDARGGVITPPVVVIPQAPVVEPVPLSGETPHGK